MTKKDLLLMSAARLYGPGVDVEGARARLRELADAGVPYDSAEMRAALENFRELSAQFKTLEEEHLALRAELLRE